MYLYVSKDLYLESILTLFFALVFQFLSGAVVTARHFRYPVSIARAIMDKSPHCALSGEGAHEFAQRLRLDGICEPEELKGGNGCPNQKTGISNEKFGGYSDHDFMGKPIQPQECDSVGAVAIDRNGNLACANSAGIVINLAQAKQVHPVEKLSYIYVQHIFFHLPFATRAGSPHQHISQ